jgi:hypothetical protein
MGRKSTSGSGIRDEQPGSYFLELRNHFIVLEDPDPAPDQQALDADADPQQRCRSGWFTTFSKPDRHPQH